MFTSISLFSSANAGELSVSGTAKATYNIVGETAQKKGLGVTNELNFTASGELDNGYTWSYSMELDPGANDATNESTMDNDDTKLTLTTPYGTVGVFISEGGLDVEDAASQSVYARPTDTGDPSATSDNFTIDAYNNMQYHMPADLLPFGIVGKVAYAPSLEAYGSGNNKGPAETVKAADGAGDSATEYQIKAAPIDGLAIGASYMEFSREGLAKNDQGAESGAYFATYTMGNIGVGYSKAYKAPLLADYGLTGVEYYDQSNASIGFAINDDLSVSYETEKSEANYRADATVAVEQKSDAIQAAYTMGGMTIALSMGTYDNIGYVADTDAKQTLIAVTMAF